MTFGMDIFQIIKFGGQSGHPRQFGGLFQIVLRPLKRGFHARKTQRPSFLRGVPFPGFRWLFVGNIFTPLAHHKLYFASSGFHTD